VDANDQERVAGPSLRVRNEGSVSGMLRSGTLPRWLLTVAVFGALWYMLVECLAQYWAVEPEYSFGWLVPILSGYLFWLRWSSRPVPELPKTDAIKNVVWLIALGLLPTWLIVQANPDWRVSAWLLAGQTVVLSLGVIYWFGGKAWLQHFAFSVCLILTAVPWPSFLENGVVRTLTQVSTVFTVEALNGLGVHAVRHGTVIELRSGFVGLDDACSGIRSLQAGLMLSVFLGELYRTTVQRRFILIIAGAAFALACNCVRTILLVMVGAKAGIESIAAWHDPIGYALLTTFFLIVLGTARLFCRRLPVLQPAAQTKLVPYPYPLIIGLGAWLFLVGVGTEVWYRLHAPAQTPQWTVAWPLHKADFSDVPITKQESAVLLFSEGRGAEWNDEDGSHWVAYLFRWAQGPAWSRILARGHRPEICFPAAGYKPCGDHGRILVQADGLSIPFHALDFDDGKNKEYVFFCLWEQGAKDSAEPDAVAGWSQLARLKSVLLGERGLAQQTLEIVITGCASPEQAQAALRREITTLIQVRRPGHILADSNW
jgi:exosortase